MIFVDLVLRREVVGVGSRPVPLQSGPHVVVTHKGPSSRRMHRFSWVLALRPRRSDTVADDARRAPPSRLDDGIDCGLPAGMTTPSNNGITGVESRRHAVRVTALGSCGVRLACTLVSTRRLVTRTSIGGSSSKRTVASDWSWPAAGIQGSQLGGESFNRCPSTQRALFARRRPAPCRQKGNCGSGRLDGSTSARPARPWRSCAATVGGLRIGAPLLAENTAQVSARTRKGRLLSMR